MQAFLIAGTLLVFNLVVVDLLLSLNFIVLQRSENWTMGRESKIVNPGCAPIAYSKNGYTTFADFYPYYLGEHHHKVNRRLHLIGTTNSILILLFSLITGYYPLLVLVLPQGYALAWIGHYIFEKNKPATFSHPVYSVRFFRII